MCDTKNKIKNTAIEKIYGLPFKYLAILFDVFKKNRGLTNVIRLIIDIEGEALDDVEVGGVVTHTIIDLLSDESPV